jgi:hypothetical protein
MITKVSVAVGLVVLLFGSPSFAQDAANQKFLKEAIEGNLTEVQMRQLAQSRAPATVFALLGKCWRRII